MDKRLKKLMYIALLDRKKELEKIDLILEKHFSEHLAPEDDEPIPLEVFEAIEASKLDDYRISLENALEAWLQAHFGVPDWRSIIDLERAADPGTEGCGGCRHVINTLDRIRGRDGSE